MISQSRLVSSRTKAHASFDRVFVRSVTMTSYRLKINARKSLHFRIIFVDQPFATCYPMTSAKANAIKCRIRNDERTLPPERLVAPAPLYRMYMNISTSVTMMKIY